MNLGAPGSRQITSGHWFHAGGRLVRHETVEQRQGAVLSSHPEHGAHGPQLVWGVCIPLGGGVTPSQDLLPVSLEGAIQRGLRQRSELSAGGDRDSGRGGVEVAQVGGARDVVDAVRWVITSAIEA